MVDVVEVVPAAAAQDEGASAPDRADTRYCIKEGRMVVSQTGGAGAEEARSAARKVMDGVAVAQRVRRFILACPPDEHSVPGIKTTQDALSGDAAVEESKSGAAEGSAGLLPAVVILDDVTTLGGLWTDARALHCAIELRRLASHHPNVCSVTVAHADCHQVPSSVLPVLEHAVDVVLALRPLSSGKASDVTGEIVAQRRRTASRTLPIPVTLQYRMRDDGASATMFRRGDVSV